MANCYEHILRLREEAATEWRAYRDAGFPSCGDKAYNAARYDMAAAQSAERDAFAKSRGWIYTGGACPAGTQPCFTIEQLPTGRLRFRKHDHWLSHPRGGRLEYFVSARWPHQPVAIVAHGRALFGYSNYLAVNFDLKVELLPDSWLTPGKRQAVLFTRWEAR